MGRPSTEHLLHLLEDLHRQRGPAGHGDAQVARGGVERGSSTTVAPVPKPEFHLHGLAERVEQRQRDQVHVVLDRPEETVAAQRPAPTRARHWPCSPRSRIARRRRAGTAA
jgi:hypothetical protein